MLFLQDYLELNKDKEKLVRKFIKEKKLFVCVGYDKDDRPYLCPQDDLIVTRDFSLENIVDVENPII